jgi:hypothetical protein
MPAAAVIPEAPKAEYHEEESAQNKPGYMPKIANPHANDESEAPVIPIEKPSLAKGMAQDWMKRIGASETKPEMPTYGGPGAKPEQGALIPAEQLHKDEQKFAATPEQRGIRNEDRQAKVADLEKQRQDALYRGDQTTADRLQVAKAQLEQTPWKDRSGMSKFGKIMSTVGNIAGDLIAPNVLAAIPGTDLHKAMKTQGAYNRIAPDVEADYKQAQIDAEKNKPAPVNPNAGKTITTDKGIMQFNPATQRFDIPAGGVPAKNEKDNEGKTIITDKGIMQWNPETSRYDIPAGGAPPEKGNQELHASMATMGKVYATHPFDPTKPESVKAAQEAAVKDGTITPQELATEKAYQLDKGDKATTVNINQNAEQRKAAAKLAGETYTYTDEKGTHMVSGDSVPEGAETTKIKDKEAFIKEAEQSNIIQTSINHLNHSDLSIFDSDDARAILSVALADNSSMDVSAGPAAVRPPEALEAQAKKYMQNNGTNLDAKTRQKVQDYIADYWGAKDKLLMVQMQMQNGKIGRGNKAYFDALLAQLPGANTANKAQAQRQLSNFKETLDALRTKYPDKYGAYSKVPSTSVSGATTRVTGPAGTFDVPNDKVEEYKKHGYQ